LKKTIYENSAQLELMFRLVELEFSFIHILSYWLRNLPESERWWLESEYSEWRWWWLECQYSDLLWLSFSLALAKPNKKQTRNET
jgi:hypothetical protein